MKGIIIFLQKYIKLEIKSLPNYRSTLDGQIIESYRIVITLFFNGHYITSTETIIHI